MLHRSEEVTPSLNKSSATLTTAPSPQPLCMSLWTMATELWREHGACYKPNYPQRRQIVHQNVKIPIVP